MFNKSHLNQTVDIVGDPFAAESKWMPLCTAAGSKPLARRRSPATTALISGGKVVSIAFIASNAMMALFCMTMIADHFCWLMTGFDTNWFMDQTALARVFAVDMLALGTLGFWKSFGFAKAPAWFNWLTACGLLLLFAVACTGGLYGAIMAGASVTAFYGMSALAKMVRESMPISFDVDRTLMYKGLASCTLGSIFLAALFSAFGAHETAPYTAPDMATLVLCQISLAIAVGVPSAAIARLSKSGSVRHCVGLNLLLQSPVYLAFGVFAAINGLVSLGCILNPQVTSQLLAALSMPAMSSALPGAGLQVAAGTAAAMASCAVITAGGSALGARANRNQTKAAAIEEHSTGVQVL